VSITRCGVPSGAASAIPDATRYYATPDSCSVATFGNTA
jgi:hypothetical protein